MGRQASGRPSRLLRDPSRGFAKGPEGSSNSCHLFAQASRGLRRVCAGWREPSRGLRRAPAPLVAGSGGFPGDAASRNQTCHSMLAQIRQALDHPGVLTLPMRGRR